MQAVRALGRTFALQHACKELVWISRPSNSTFSFREIVQVKDTVLKVHQPESKDLSPSAARLYKQLNDYENSLELFDLVKTLKSSKHLAKEHLELTVSQLAKDQRYDELMELKKIYAGKNLTPSTEAYNNIFTALFRQNSKEAGANALSLWEDMKANAVTPNQTTFETIIAGLSSCSGDFSKAAFEIFNEMKGQNLKASEDLYFQVLVPLAEKNQLEEAEQVAAMIQNALPSPDIKVYNILIKLYTNKRNNEKLNFLLDRMKQANVEKDNVTWSLLIDYYKQDDAKMQSLIAEMESVSIPFDHNILSAMMSFHASKDNTETAEVFFSKIVEADQVPLEFALTSLLGHYSKKGDVKRAVQLFEYIKKTERGANVDQYLLMGEGFIENDEFDKWDALVDEMEDLKMPRTLQYYELMMKRTYYDMNFRISDSERYLEIMKEDGIRPTLATYTALITAYCADRDMEGAQIILEKLRREGIEPEPDTYFAIVNGYLKVGNLKAAAPFIHRLSTLDSKEFISKYEAQQIEQKE